MKFSFELKRKCAKKNSLQYLKFIPEEAETKWDETEIHPIIEDENGYCEVVNEGQESFWSVYLHQSNGGLRCIADLPTKNDAIKFEQLLKEATKTRNHNSHFFKEHLNYSIFTNIFNFEGNQQISFKCQEITGIATS